MSSYDFYQRLAEYFADAAPTAGPYWTAAASSASIKSNVKKLPVSSSALSSLPVLNLNQPSQFIQRPPTQDELLAWGSSISSKQVGSGVTGVTGAGLGGVQHGVCCCNRYR